MLVSFQSYSGEETQNGGCRDGQINDTKLADTTTA